MLRLMHQTISSMALAIRVCSCPHQHPAFSSLQGASHVESPTECDTQPRSRHQYYFYNTRHNYNLVTQHAHKAQLLYFVVA